MSSTISMITITHKNVPNVVIKTVFLKIIFMSLMKTFLNLIPINYFVAGHSFKL